ncbi:YlxR family protein [Mycolicibacter minnesotensis]
MVAVSTGNGNDAVRVDHAGNLPGRGAWLHPAPDCLHSAIRRRAFVRALRISGSPDVTGVEEDFQRFGDRCEDRLTPGPQNR